MEHEQEDGSNWDKCVCSRGYLEFQLEQLISIYLSVQNQFAKWHSRY